ncbi:hypothetical protein SAMN02745131_03043 [Flavisolibacter ginsengisoli DSM 18119]|uniref:Uncharacterized protein n=1 Tax=Flavisolibacter ginsengisoli DSM 18119 TaxID=1121884 RepID=A0A1M5CVF1_9BACT|nr:hypothetical protein SAMN02745131_03043 [Flavisolibacter ginsengisoli DSM 18119]
MLVAITYHFIEVKKIRDYKMALKALHIRLRKTLREEGISFYKYRGCDFKSLDRQPLLLLLLRRHISQNSF